MRNHNSIHAKVNYCFLLVEQKCWGIEECNWRSFEKLFIKSFCSRSIPVI
jgi:hypothetical protein